MENEIGVILAAGLGTRMLPLTDTIAKPLVKVNGIVLIESVIHALMVRGVGQVYIVVGYKKEQFRYLKEKYSFVTLIENESYQVQNNISSLYAVKEKVRGHSAFICEADLLISDKYVLNASFDRSCYFGKMVHGWSTDWVFDRDASGRITRVGKGGKDVFNMVGVAWFQADDATFLMDVLEKEYENPNHRDWFWDDVVNKHLDNLNLYVHEVSESTIREFDSLEELATTDNYYRQYLHSE